MRITYFRIGAIAAVVTVSCLISGGAAHGTPETADPQTAAPESIVHQVPQVPLTINGESVPPTTITKYNGRPLYMTVIPGGSPKGQLQAFTELADFERSIHEHGGPEHVAANPQQAPTPAAATALNSVPPPQHPEPKPDQTDMSANSPTSWIYSGDLWTFFSLGAGVFTGYPDLTQVDMICAPWCISWNDEASSVIPSDRGLLLFEHIWYGGSSLFIPAGWPEPFLAAYGWDNRTSSLQS